MLAEDYYYWDETFEESHNATMIDICEAKIGMKTLPCKIVSLVELLRPLGGTPYSLSNTGLISFIAYFNPLSTDVVGFCPTLPEELFPVLGEFVGGGWRPATHLPRASQTCSFGSMSGKHAGHSIRTIHSSKRKSSTRLARGSLQLSSIKMKSSPIAAA
ncbi:hypothetical protein TNCV_958821 [Trichonephila clavipes]|nr:hypothetical protein TNCV_958821 [Trichonephila clavipes]